ncbi:hypothetical protein, partial [Streptomyces rochei]|uniref:hypothetical protein n=1 Tax=Streptomyces rochei TaxID=1928 RepID=UPI0022E9FD24
IWCSLDRETQSLRVVGWYDNATAFREARRAESNSIREAWRYYFRTKYENAHLIPEAERELVVPTRIRRTDKGFIGQRNWHFPEQYTVQHQRFLDSFAALKLGYSVSATRTQIDRRSFEEGQQATSEIIATVRNPGLVKAAKARYGYNCSV